MVVSKSTLSEVEAALNLYRCEIEALESMKDNTKKTYIDRADKFVRWLKGDFVPGCRTEG